MTDSLNMTQWFRVDGIVKPGHQVASGRAKDSPYPRGTIEMQTPFFQALGLNLTPFFPGTLNISIAPYTFEIITPESTFRQVKWHPDYPAEDFSFSPCRVIFQKIVYDCLIYYPHPETKIGHFQDISTIEVIAPFISNLDYEKQVQLEVNYKVIMIKKSIH